MPLITIDAGHGGEDPGATVGELREADIALAFAEELGRQLIRRGATIALTRDDDRSVTLAKRCRIANELGSAAFVSLHCNAAGSRRAHGFQALHCKTSKRGLALAQWIYAQVSDVVDVDGSWSGVLPDQSVHTGYTSAAAEYAATLPADLSWRERDERVRERFGDDAYRTLYVLRGTRMAAVLVELGFLTHACDRGHLVDPEWRRRVCGAIAEGVVEWYEREVQP